MDVKRSALIHVPNLRGAYTGAAPPSSTFSTSTPRVPQQQRPHSARTPRSARVSAGLTTPAPGHVGCMPPMLTSSVVAGNASTAQQQSVVHSALGTPLENINSDDIAAVASDVGRVYLISRNGLTVYELSEQGITPYALRYSEKKLVLYPDGCSAAVLNATVYLWCGCRLYQAEVNTGDKTFYWEEVLLDAALPVTDWCTLAACSDTRALYGITDRGLLFCRPNRRMSCLWQRPNAPSSDIKPSAVIIHFGYIFALVGTSLMCLRPEMEGEGWRSVDLAVEGEGDAAAASGGEGEQSIGSCGVLSALLTPCEDMEMVQLFVVNTTEVRRYVSAVPYTTISCVETSVRQAEASLRSTDDGNTADHTSSNNSCGADYDSAAQRRLWCAQLRSSAVFVDRDITLFKEGVWQQTKQSVRGRSAVGKRQFPRPPTVAPIQVMSVPRTGNTSLVTLNIKSDEASSFRRHVHGMLQDNPGQGSGDKEKELVFNVQGQHPQGAQVSIACRNTTPTEVQFSSSLATDDVYSNIYIDFLDTARKLRIRYAQRVYLSEAGCAAVAESQRDLERKWQEVENTQSELEAYRQRLMSEWDRMKQTETELTAARKEADELKAQLLEDQQSVAEERESLKRARQSLQDRIDAEKERELDADRRRRQEKERQRLSDRDRDNELKKLQKMERVLLRKINEKDSETKKLEQEQNRMNQDRESYKKDIAFAKEKETAWEKEHAAVERAKRQLQEELRVAAAHHARLEDDIKRLQQLDKDRRDMNENVLLKLDYCEGRAEGEADYEWAKRRQAMKLLDEETAKGSFEATFISVHFKPVDPTVYVQGTALPLQVCTIIDCDVEPNVQFSTLVVEVEIGEGFMVGDSIYFERIDVEHQVVSTERNDLLRIEFAKLTSLMKTLNATLGALRFCSAGQGDAFVGSRCIEIFLQLTPTNSRNVTSLTCRRIVSVVPPVIEKLPNAALQFNELTPPMPLFQNINVFERCLTPEEAQRLPAPASLECGIKGLAVLPATLTESRQKDLQARWSHVAGRRCLVCSQLRKVTNTGGVGKQPTFTGDPAWWRNAKISLRIKPAVAGDTFVLSPGFAIGDGKTREISRDGETVALLQEGELLTSDDDRTLVFSSAVMRISLAKSADNTTLQSFLTGIHFHTGVANPDNRPRRLALLVQTFSGCRFSSEFDITVRRNSTPIVLKGLPGPVTYVTQRHPSHLKVQYSSKDIRRHNAKLALFSQCELVPVVHDIVDGGYIVVEYSSPPQPGDHFGILDENKHLVTEHKFSETSRLQDARRIIDSIVFYSTTDIPSDTRTFTLRAKLGADANEQVVVCNLKIEPAYIGLTTEAQMLTYVEKTDAIPILHCLAPLVPKFPFCTLRVILADAPEQGDVVQCTIPDIEMKELPAPFPPLMVRGEAVAATSAFCFAIGSTSVALFLADYACYLRFGGIDSLSNISDRRSFNTGEVSAEVIIKVAHHIYFRHNTDNPLSIMKVARASIIDDEWCQSDVELNIRVVPVDDPTEIRGPSELTYYQGTTATQHGLSIGEELEMYDPDTDDYSGGFLKVELLQSEDPKDELFVSLRSPEKYEVQQRARRRKVRESMILLDGGTSTSGERTPIPTSHLHIDGDNDIYIFANRAEFEQWEKTIEEHILNPESVPAPSKKPIGRLHHSASKVHFVFHSDRGPVTLALLQQLLASICYRNDNVKCTHDDRALKISVNAGVAKDTGFPIQPDTVRTILLHVSPARMHYPGFTSTLALKEGTQLLFKTAVVGPGDAAPVGAIVRLHVLEGHMTGDSLSVVLRASGAFEISGGRLTSANVLVGTISVQPDQIVVEVIEGGKLDNKTLQAYIRSLQYTILPTNVATATERIITLSLENFILEKSHGASSAVIDTAVAQPIPIPTLTARIRRARAEVDVIRGLPDTFECIVMTPAVTIAPWASLAPPVVKLGDPSSDVFHLVRLFCDPAMFTVSLGASSSIGDKLAVMQDAVLTIENDTVWWNKYPIAEINATDQKITLSLKRCPISVLETFIQRVQYVPSGKRDKPGTKRPVTFALQMVHLGVECQKTVSLLLGAPLIEGPSNGTFIFKGEKCPIVGPIRLRAGYNFSKCTMIVDLVDAGEQESLVLNEHSSDLCVTLRGQEGKVTTKQNTTNAICTVLATEQTVQFEFGDTSTSPEIAMKVLQLVCYVQKEPKDFSKMTAVEVAVTAASGARCTAQVHANCQIPSTKKKR